MSDYINAAAGPSGGYSMEQPPAHNLNEFQQALVLDLLSEGQSNPDVIGPLIKRTQTMTPAKRRKARMEQIETMGGERLRQASQKGVSKRGPRFFGKDEGLTTEAPENPGSFFPHGKDHDVIDLTRDTSVPTETTDSSRDDSAEPGN